MALSRIANVYEGLGYLVRSLLGRSSLIRQLRYLWSYPGLSIAPSANLVIKGRLNFDKGATVGEGCNLLVPEGATLDIGAGCYLGRYVELGPSGKIWIGANSSIQDRSILVGDVSIGRYCVLSLNVLMTSGTHYFDKWPSLLIRDQDMRVASDARLNLTHSRPIFIEEDCWLGMNAVVMPGVTVGRGAVVGSNAVVTRNLPPYSVAVGVPAKIVRQRFPFDPPSAMEWSADEHTPYFYRGFETSDAERKQHADLGGHFAPGPFALSLKRGGAGRICIRARSLSGSKVCVSQGGVSHELSDVFADYEFDDDHASEDPMSPVVFQVSGGPVVVSGAWTR